MQKHLFLTGPSGCGKSEAVRRTLGPALLGAGGFVTSQERDRDGKLQRSLLLPTAAAGGAEGFEALPYLDLRGMAPPHDNEVCVCCRRPPGILFRCWTPSAASSC